MQHILQTTTKALQRKMQHILQTINEKDKTTDKVVDWLGFRTYVLKVSQSRYKAAGGKTKEKNNHASAARKNTRKLTRRETRVEERKTTGGKEKGAAKNHEQTTEEWNTTQDTTHNNENRNFQRNEGGDGVGILSSLPLLPSLPSLPTRPPNFPRYWKSTPLGWASLGGSADALRTPNMEANDLARALTFSKTHRDVTFSPIICHLSLSPTFTCWIFRCQVRKSINPLFR